ncbi:MAG: hypothetical protein ACWA5A_11330 [Marinibacterium sp.]
MRRLIKFVIYLVALAFIALTVYAYFGPLFGVDFSAPQGEVRKPVTLDAK